jgi:hypothetical protein
VFSKAKVCYLDVPIRVEQDVLWLQVSVYNVELVEVVERKGDLCGVEFGYRVWETLEVDSALPSTPQKERNTHIGSP